MSMRSHYVLGLGPGGFHRVAFTDWGVAQAAHTVVAVHGLARNSRDFDRLAAALTTGVSAGRFRVVCPDMPGRGRSDWLPAPEQYSYAQYMADMTVLIAHLDAASIDWIGTSMGGILGMMMAAQPGTPIRRLVLNDVGPAVPKAALERLATYVGRDPHFPTLDALEAYLRQTYAAFGPLTDADWRHLAINDHRRLEGGGFGLAYDPKIAVPFRQAIERELDLWPVWDAIACPVLVLRGAQSDVLPAKTLAEMKRRGPAVAALTFEGVGHAPALMAEDQIAVVRDWLAKEP
jgi:pimeloyl-ACP methyl ester carboxylesterase